MAAVVAVEESEFPQHEIDPCVLG